MFGLACEREADIFEIGLQAPPTPFQIIPDGTYSIHVSSSKSLQLVLAVQNVTNAQPPLDKYLPRNGGSSVVGKKKTGGDHQKVGLLGLVLPYTDQPRSGSSPRRELDAQSGTWGQAFILGHPQHPMAENIVFCKPLRIPTVGGSILVQASQTKDLRCTSMFPLSNMTQQD